MSKYAQRNAAGLVLQDQLGTGTGDSTKFLRGDGTWQVPGGGGPHATTHQNNGSDEINVAGLSGELADPQPPKTHATAHQPGGGDAMAVDAVAGTGSLRTLGTGAQQACAGNDSRLSDARTPTAHAVSHKSGGGDAIKLDELAAPTDVTTLNTSTAQHGLCPKLSGSAGDFLNGTGAFSAPTAQVSATTVEINLGSSAVFRGKFTITDAAITAAKKVLCWQAPGPYTGKGTRADEAELQPVQVIAVSPAAGSATVYWQTPPLLTFVSPGPAAMDVVSSKLDALGCICGPKRIGRARGNVTFTYTVMA